MTETDKPAPGGGPSSQHGGSRTAVSNPAGASPSHPGFDPTLEPATDPLLPTIPTAADPFPDPTIERHAYHAVFSRAGVTPLPYMAASLVSIALAIWAARWARTQAADAPRSEWWFALTAVVAPSEDFGWASSDFRMWVALAILIGSVLVTLVWVGRLGRNVRLGDGEFGFLLPLIALPAWWTLPFTVGLAHGGENELYVDNLMRYSLALVMLISQFVLLRWTALNHVWHAGKIPFDILAILLWLPMMIPWAIYLGSVSYTLGVVGEGDPLSDSAWLPTQAMVDWATALTRITFVAVIALLIAVSIRQHAGLLRDRAGDLEARKP